MKQRRKWGSVKETVARLAHLTAPQIVRETGISRYSVYESARQQQIKLPPPVFKRKRLYSDV
jgi:predicted DNA-binding transcriptional regulator AlpA